MNRRCYLASIGTKSVLLTGCLGKGQIEPEKSLKEEFPTVELKSDPVPRDQPFNVEISTVQQYSEKKPARVRIRITNTSRENQLFYFGAVAPFGELIAEHSDKPTRLFLIPDKDQYIGGSTDEFVPSIAEEGCWQTQRKLLIHTVRQGRRLEPEESCTANYTLLSDTSNLCLEEGVYRVENDNYINNITWGFDISLIY